MSNKQNKFNRNRSFDQNGRGGGGTGGGLPSTLKKHSNSNSQGGKQPARRSVSHDVGTLRDQNNQNATPQQQDDDGFTSIPVKKKNSRFDNNASSNSKGGAPARGRPNPTQSFTRPRPTNSFSKPRPTGSFKKNRDGNNSNNNNGKKQMYNSSKSFDASSANKRNPSFQKPKPTGSFNSRINNNDNEEALTLSTAAILNSNAAAIKRSDYRRSTSRLTAYDVDLFEPGDGKTEEQKLVVRHHVDHLMQARLFHTDPPDFGDIEGKENPTPNVDDWCPHYKCLWSDPTRREQIEQVMTKYPNAIPIQLKTRKRIKSSKLGDSTPMSSAASLASGYGGAASVASVGGLGGASLVSEDDWDDSSIGASNRSNNNNATNNDGMPAVIVQGTASMEDQEENNPLRKTLLLLNKLSWTTIDKLTPKFFDVLEQDVPALMALMQPPPPVTNIKTTTMATESEDPSEGGLDGSAAENNTSNEDSNNDNAVDATPSPSAQTELAPMVSTILTLLVEKAQTEPHFSAMYAQLCKNLADRNPLWKKKILAHCQKEFERDIAWHIARYEEELEGKSVSNEKMEDISLNTNGTEQLDGEYMLLQIRKKYFGHVQFLGELFRLKLIKLDIIIWSLSRLLFFKEEVDEDDLESFAKLMTVVGEEADAMVKKGKCHTKAEAKWHQCWDRVYFLTGRTPKNKKTASPPSDEKPPKISSRIKFMLVDLLELEENDWVHRREKEKPKTIAEIHQEVEDEEAEARRRSFSDDWSGCSNSSRRRRHNSEEWGYSANSSYRSKPQKIVDSDGFTQVPGASSKRNSFARRSQSDVDEPRMSGSGRWQDKSPSPGSLRGRGIRSHKSMDSSSKRRSTTTRKPSKIVEYPTPEECKEKTKTILKEYFVGGDTQDCILSIDEIVGAEKSFESHGSIERGAAVIESGVLMVMEMKQQEVQKFLAVIKRCLQQNKIEKASLPLGLKDPLEFLSDIEIDAPMARALLTSMVSYWVRQESLPFDFLLNAPDYFKTDCKAAEFAAAVLKMRGGDASEADLAVVEKLMTDNDKEKYATAKQILEQSTS